MSLRPSLAAVVAILAVGLTLACLSVGYEPIASDPDGMYRPFKVELARALARGTLPFWSDLLGLGVPLVAESHVAAFYPPNWLAYRFVDTLWAFRLSIWIHQVATAAALYLYARSLGLERWGSSLSAVSFSLCGFASAHSGHEPLYLVMPYLPVCLLATGRFVTSGRIAWLAVLALAWGVQLTLGHFQVQMWTGVLAFLTGLWQILAEGRPRRRIVALSAALSAGLAIASVQLGLTWELTRISGFTRSREELITYLFPPGQWIQPVFPSFFSNRPEVDKYLAKLGSTGVESTFYIGTLPLVFALIGWIGSRGTGKLGVWKFVIVASLVLATLPGWSHTAAWVLTFVPGLGWFRCPGRYTLLASLGLSLLAGQGMDRAIRRHRFVIGVVLAALMGVGAVAWAFHQADVPGFRESLGAGLPVRLALAFGCWTGAIALAMLWRARWVPAWSLVVISAIELAVLFHLGPVKWGWSIPFPEQSPIARRLLEEPGVGLVAGPPQNLLVRAGLTAAFPYVGITPPPPTYLLATSKWASQADAPGVSVLNERFGVTHGVWREGDLIPRSDVIFTSTDPTLDALIKLENDAKPGLPWTIVKYKNAWPPAWASPRALVVPDWNRMFPRLLNVTSRDVAIYLSEDAPPDSTTPRANTATVHSWDGATAIVEHDGACDLTIRRAFYPGWTASINGAPPQAVLKGNGGLQMVRLEGQGPSRVRFRYEPTSLRRGMILSLFSTSATLMVLALGTVPWLKNLGRAVGTNGSRDHVEA